MEATSKRCFAAQCGAHQPSARSKKIAQNRLLDELAQLVPVDACTVKPREDVSVKRNHLSDGITILGQTLSYPSSLWGTLAVLFLCAAVTLGIYFIVRANPEQIRATGELWKSIRVESDGSQVIQKDTVRIEFWTPSSKTKEYLTKEGRAVADKDKWEILESDEKVEQFGDLLHSDSRVSGYRRSEVFGHGRTTLKAGYWWTMRVKSSYGVSDLSRAYREFWKAPDSIFVEVFNNEGHYEK